MTTVGSRAAERLLKGRGRVGGSEDRPTPVREPREGSLLSPPTLYLSGLEVPIPGPYISPEKEV